MRGLFAQVMGRRGTVRAEVSRGVVGSLGFTVANLALRLGTGVLLARVLGAGGLGAYSFALAVVGLLQVPTQLGLPQVVTREVAALREKGQWGLLRGLLTRANQGVGLLGVVTALLALAIGWASMRGSDSVRVWAFLAALPLVPIVALSSLRQAALRGFRHVLQGQAPELIIQPGILAAVLGLGYLLIGSRFLSATEAVWLNVGAALVAFGAGSLFLIKGLPKEVKAHEPEYRSRQWLHSALPFVALAGLYMVNNRLTTVMLGAFRPDAEVGLYQVCSTAAVPVIFGLQAANAVASPHIARLWARRDLLALQKLVTGSARVGLAVALPLALVLMLLGGPLLAFFFGEEFRRGSTALLLIVIGQLINAAFGSNGSILNMTGHTKYSLRGLLVAAVLNVILNLLLIPRWGIEGSAVAAMVTFAVWNIIYFAYARREVGVISLAFGGRRWGPKENPPSTE